ncbi:ROK family protein [Flavivirga spongiicola]|uniref:ROK family protein n=1 Tax=Flavivirga spongiicola TaxID=421621 RepID=A0ABU7XW96_9FLAO|nr:ROK family protein [Flavivirga sp. MEBiC05379]MDO5980049.1 ROK family protein [Flavivirga sp. MEBiC05379]
MNENIGIGIDLGGTSIKSGLVSSTGKILWESKRPTKANTSQNEVIQNILDVCDEAMSAASQKNIHVATIGLGTPGLVDNEDVIVGGAENIIDWINVPMGQLIKSNTKLSAYVANDADMMAMGELYFSNSDAIGTALFLTLGTGIGGALFVDGKLFQGHYGFGGEYGLFPMIINNDVLYWEEVASTAAMVKKYKDSCKNKPSNIKMNGEYIVKKYFENEALAQKVVNDTSKLVGLGISGYINVFNPKKIIIGGGISMAGGFFIEKIKESAQQYAIKESFENVQILSAKLGNKAGFIGAGIYALNRKNNL